MRQGTTMMKPLLAPILVAAAIAATPAAAQETEESWLPTLSGETPEQGFDLAVSMARKAVTTAQTDAEILHALRPNYSHDPQSLIDVSGVVAGHFATIAAGTDYWRD